MNQPQDSLAQRPLLRFVRRALHNWLERHRHPFSFWIHMIGIPMTVVGVALVILYPSEWYWGVGAFGLGYLLQFIGHVVEGNDMGEWAGIKRLFGLPYVAISPRWQKQDGGTPVPSNT
jgi:hypothetical protein